MYMYSRFCGEWDWVWEWPREWEWDREWDRVRVRKRGYTICIIHCTNRRLEQKQKSYIL